VRKSARPPARSARSGVNACLSGIVAVLMFGLIASLVGQASGSSLTVRQRLIRCLNAVNGIYVGPVKPRTPQVSILNRKVVVVKRRCDANTSVLGTKAGEALFDLALGVGDYQQYLIGVAFERPDRTLLRQAQREIARGKAEARRVLR
jgi:hypothetical protein